VHISCEMVSGFDVIELTVNKNSRTLSNLLWKKLNKTVFDEHPRLLMSKSIVGMPEKFWSYWEYEYVQLDMEYLNSKILIKL